MSARRRGSVHAYWDTDGRWYEPRLRGDWPVSEVGDALSEDSGIELTRWIELAEAFLDDLELDQMRRTS